MARVPKFTVAIVGGGISGVTLAVALSKYPDIEFNLYESAGAFEEIGAALGISARSIDALEAIGILEALKQLQTGSSNTGPNWQYRKADIQPTGQDFAGRIHPPQKGSGSYHRAQLLSLFVSLLPKQIQEEHVHFRKRLTRYEQRATGTPVVLYFADGTTAECDILIGADGIKSPTRHGMFAERADLETDVNKKEDILKWAVPRWTGMVAYRGLIPAAEVETSLGMPHRTANNVVIYCGRKAHLVVFPIPSRQLINVVAFVSRNVIPEHKVTGASVASGDRTWPSKRPWVEPAPQEEMLEAYADFEEEVLRLLKALKNPSRWAIHELEPLPFYAYGNVALLGDAAHATQPHQGQGANQSIEDAYVLSVILASQNTTKATIPRALKAYERARLERANHVIRCSSKMGKMHQFMMDPLYDDLDKLQEYIASGADHKWLFLGSPLEDTEAALEWMVE
ncbi:FAD/NAD-P-binding domain-containing protein [Mycena floridula]|nr:FAD/NAD-P-binding domain-containing protein [Mycena floridula]